MTSLLLGLVSRLKFDKLASAQSADLHLPGRREAVDFGSEIGPSCVTLTLARVSVIGVPGCGRSQSFKGFNAGSDPQSPLEDLSERPRLA